MTLCEKAEVRQASEAAGYAKSGPTQTCRTQFLSRKYQLPRQQTGQYKTVELFSFSLMDCQL